MERSWISSDRRDRGREFAVVQFGEIEQINGAFVSILCLIAVPRSGGEDVILIDRIVTADVRRNARAYVDAFTSSGSLLRENGGPDRDHTANVRNRLASVERDAGPVSLRLAVYRIRERVRARPRNPPKPTEAMLSRVRARLRDDGDRGVRWESAATSDELPVAPHDRATLAIVGVDAKGRVHDVPKPPIYDLDRARGRDLRSLARAVVKHEMFSETIRVCEARGLMPLFVYRMAQKVAA